MERVLVEIRGVEPRATQKILFIEEYSHRIDLLSGRASSMPNLHEREGHQHRHERFPNGLVERRIAKQLRDGDGYRGQEFIEGVFIVEKLVEQLGKAAHLFTTQHVMEPSLQ